MKARKNELNASSRNKYISSTRAYRLRADSSFREVILLRIRLDYVRPLLSCEHRAAHEGLLHKRDI